MTMFRGLLALSFVAAELIAGAQKSDGAPNTLPTPEESPRVADAVAGKDTFTQYCSICHGARAKGFIGPYIAGIAWTAPGLHAIVRGGLGGYGGMPAFNADAVTDENIADIAAYLASLPPASTPKSQTPQIKTVSASEISAPPSAAEPFPPETPDPVHGRQVYTANCAACHGASAQGGFGPALRGEKTRKNTTAAIAWIKNPLPPMPKLYPATLSAKDVDDVAAYVESL